MRQRTQIAWRIIASGGVSLLILGLMMHLFLSGVPPGERPELIPVLRNTALAIVAVYLVSAVIQAFFRACRYRILIAADGVQPPRLAHVYLVTIIRNMLVDLLPARLGELSYIALMNRGCRVKGETCVSSLAVSFVFDFVALLFLVAGILGYQVLTAGVQGWLITTALVLLLGCVVLLAVVFAGVRFGSAVLERLLGRFAKRKPIGLALDFVRKTASSIEKTRRAGVLLHVLLLSFGVRIVKYTGLYLLFRAVVLPNFHGFAGVSVAGVVSALVGAEGAASLPVPAFMSFGTYEAGGSLALTLLGFKKAESLIAMLAMHIWSQWIDYSLGAAASVLFLFRSRSVAATETAAPPRSGRAFAVAAAAALVLGLAFLGFEFRKTRKLGALTPPGKGETVAVPPERQQALQAAVKDLRGFVVWSSNRFGNHDILMLSLPGLKRSRLTQHPHVDTFPRISPDGHRIVFARSQVEWVSQRNEEPWNVHLLDLETGEESLLAENGNVPTWSPDGKRVYFQRNRTTFVEHDVGSGAETILYRSGTDDLPASAGLQTPSFSPETRAMAVTLRGGRRGTAVFSPDGRIAEVGGGCQLTWGPESAYLYYVDKGGRMQNLIYRVDPDSFERTAWLDLPLPWSHEYFPKVSNDGRLLVLGASAQGHEHDAADYEIFLWRIGTPPEAAVRLTYHTGNDCWPDVHLEGWSDGVLE